MLTLVDLPVDMNLANRFFMAAFRYFLEALVPEILQKPGRATIAARPNNKAYPHHKLSKRVAAYLVGLQHPLLQGVIIPPGFTYLARARHMKST